MVGDELSKTVGRPRNSTGDWFSKHKKIRLKFFCLRVATRPGADGMGFINDQCRVIFARDLPQSFVIAVIRMHNANIGHHRLGQNTSYIFRLQCSFQRLQIIKLDNLGSDRRIHRRPHVPASRLAMTIFGQGDKALIHSPVIAPVKNQNLRSSGNLPRQSYAEAIGISSGQRELPVRQSKTFLQLFADNGCVFTGKHQRHTAANLLLDCSDHSRRRVPCHRSRIAKTKIDVPVSINIKEVRSLGLADKRGKSPSPLHHPIHRHSAQQ